MNGLGWVELTFLENSFVIFYSPILWLRHIQNMQNSTLLEYTTVLLLLLLLLDNRLSRYSLKFEIRALGKFAEATLLEKLVFSKFL